MSIIYPCLPKQLLDSLKKDPVISVANSFTFQTQFEDFRRRVVLRGDAPERVTINSCALFDTRDFSHFFDDDPLCSIVQGISQFREIDHKTYLHAAAFNEDVPATYELIRLGIDKDGKDKDGATALFVALAKLVLWRFIPKVLSNGEPLSYTTNKIKCLVRVVTLLVEQHADVNGGAYGFIPVTLAAMAAQWDIVQLLIKHGASTEDFTCLPEDERRFRTIMSCTPRPKPRPPRPCLCWSGKFLSECHAAGAQPYPDDFLCGCGKTKTHKDCCKKRGLVFEESWNTRRGCITSMQARVGIDIDDSLVPSGLKERYVEGSETMRSVIKGMTVESWEAWAPLYNHPFFNF
ncbi:hypothetical protein VNI00_019184 [Paramarasmius palmivorus]|uniref:Uncharacterized protein n=1 Tax=Paramarasmius palmivorus TaxID=297713 RepID=A0AAW0APZ0_9AGAR